MVVTNKKLNIQGNIQYRSILAIIRSLMFVWILRVIMLEMLFSSSFPRSLPRLSHIRVPFPFQAHWRRFLGPSIPLVRLASSCE